jgi:hypothetical integral membrane protein (TIGR02206 family)
VEVLYFWALTASLQAVITPDLHETVPSVFFFTYFATHCGAVVAAFLLIFGRRCPIRPGAVARAFAVTLGMAAVAGAGDLITGGNYMYLRAKPDQPSAAGRDGPVAALHRLGGRARAGAVRPAGRARAPRQP